MDYLEITGTIVGLIYLWLEYKANIYLWVAGIIMPAIYLFVYYRAGLYADFGINIYYLLVAIYGWLVWRYGAYWTRKLGKKKSSTGEKQAELPITSMPISYLTVLLCTFLALFFGIAYVLIYHTDSTVPWLDSFPTALSIIAMWMLARKYIEQWLVWIVVDMTCCGLYIYKELYFTGVLYGLYAVIAVFGYLKWKEMLEAPAQVYQTNEPL